MRVELRAYASAEGVRRMQHTVPLDSVAAVEIQIFTTWPDNRVLGDVTALYRAEPRAAVQLVENLNVQFQLLERRVREETQARIRRALGIDDTE